MQDPKGASAHRRNIDRSIKELLKKNLPGSLEGLRKLPAPPRPTEVGASLCIAGTVSRPLGAGLPSVTAFGTCCLILPAPPLPVENCEAIMN